MAVIRVAGCIIQNERGAVLLTRRCDKAVPRWESPGGKVEAGETAETAAVRECLEELGVAVRVEAPIVTTTFEQTDGSFTYEWFTATIVKGVPTVQEPTKHDDARFIHPRDFHALADPISPNLQTLVDQFPFLEGIDAA